MTDNARRPSDAPTRKHDASPAVRSSCAGSTPRLAGAPWGLRDLLAVLGLTLLTLVLLYTAAALLAALLHLRGHAGRELGAALIATLIFELSMFGLAIRFSVGKYRRGWRQFGFGPFPAAESYLPAVGIIGGYLAIAAYVALITVLHLRPLLPSSNLPEGIFRSRDLIPLAALEACLVAPVVEETLFRGFIFRGLIGKRIRLGLPGDAAGVELGFWGAALLSSFLFAALHQQVGLLIPFTGIGVLFAWLYWRSGSLWSNILAHAGFNIISFSLSLATHH